MSAPQVVDRESEVESSTSDLDDVLEPRIVRFRRINLEVNDPDISMCGCHCISYCTCNCDRGGIVS